MSGHGVAQGAGGAPDRPQDSQQRGSFLGVPLKGWAVAAVSVIFVCYAAAHAYITLRGELNEQKIKLGEKTKEAEDAQKVAKGLKAINQDTSAFTTAVTKEMEFHRKDRSGHQVVLHKDRDGQTVATFFDSDGCIAISRPGLSLPYLPGPQPVVDWSIGPDKKPAAAPPPLSSFSGATTEQSPSLGEYSTPAKSMAFRRRKPTLLRVQQGCLNPHPWPFRSWWGPANGCWAPFYRQWNDGCTHYQMYNACAGVWDPRINWTACYPNHHP